MAQPQSTIFRMQKSLGQKAELKCTKELIPNPKDPGSPFCAVRLTLTDRHRSFSNRVFDDDVAKLIEHSKFILDGNPRDLESAHRFLMDNAPYASLNHVADMIYNIVSTNSPSDVEELYYQLNACCTSPQSCSIQMDEMDGIDELLFNNAVFVCRYMRKIAYFCGNFHQLTDSILIFENANTSADKTGRGHADLCWTDTFLTIMYRPYIREDTLAAEPWKISIRERKSYTGKEASSKLPREHVTEMRISNDDYMRFIRALTPYEACENAAE